ncbi:MAG: hypothetical protein ACI8V2_003104 [Candidatus Latescibacterota bacterium]|jgi:hypothetical protein
MNPNTFVNPPAENRLLPIWYWNGVIEENEIVRQVQDMRDKGIGGFCLATGAGLNIPHLSQVWFDRVRIAIETAEECGLHVWLHDEHLSQNGLGTRQTLLGHPQFIAQQLTHRETVVQGGQQVDMMLPWAPVLSAIAVPLRRDRSLWEDAQDIRTYLGANHQQAHFAQNDTLPAYHASTYTTHTPTRRLYWKAPAGRWRVLVFLQEPIASHSQTGIHIDRLNPEAIQHLQNITLKPYLDQFATHVSKTWKGILTHQTDPSPHPLKWSPVLPDFFKERNSYSIVACLPALITNFGPNTARIRYDYFQTIGELKQKHDFAQWQNLSKQHKLHYANNVPASRTAHRSNISILGTGKTGEKIGVDQIRGFTPNPTTYQQNAVFASSLAAQTDAKTVLGTCFRNAGWALTLQDMKAQIDAAGRQGVTQFAPDGFFYTLNGLRKHSAPPSQSHQNPYWKHFRLLADYAGRLSYALSNSQPVVDIALLEPITSLWSHLSHPENDWEYFGPDKDEKALVERLISDWTYIIRALEDMQRPFHTLDPAMLSQAKIVGKEVHLGQAKYKVLVLPPMTNLEREVFEFLKDFIHADGQIIALGLIPIEDIQEGTSVVDGCFRLTDVEPSRMIRDYTGHEVGVHLVKRGSFSLIRTGGAVEKNRGSEMLDNQLNEVLPKKVHIQAQGKNTSAIQYHHRINDNQYLYFFTNTDTTSTTARIQLPSLKRNTKIELWDLETGKRTPLAGEQLGDQIVINLTFSNHQSHVVVLSNEEADISEPIEVAPLSFDIKGNWKVDPEEDNALRLSNFRMQLDPQNRGVRQGWHKPDYMDNRWADVNPKPVIEQLRDLPDTYDLPLELAPEMPQLTLPIVCWYRATFAADVVPTKLALVMDRLAIQGEYQIYINGSKLPNNAFRPTFRYDQSNITCAVGRRINKGRNVIAIRVEADQPDAGLLDALYLFGRFQVKSWRSRYLRIVAPKDKGVFHDLDALGLPFYAGTVAFTQEINFRTLPSAKEFELDLEKALKDIDDIVEVQINGHSLGVRAWAPYIWKGNTSWLKRGRNKVTLRVTNTLSRLLTGQKFQARGHKMVPIKI